MKRKVEFLELKDRANLAILYKAPLKQRAMQTTARLNIPLPYVGSEKFIQLSDEELCQKMQQGCVASRDLLWYRYDNFIQRVAYKKNRELHLSPHEMADALQELYFAFHEAVHQYDPECHSEGRLVAFKTFLGLVIARAFSNYCRQWQRYRKRVVLNLDGEASQNFAVDAKEERRFTLPSTNENGDAAADWKRMIVEELSSDGLANTLSRLKPKEIHLLQIWLQYGRDKEVAQVLGISTAAAKQRRERLFRRIKSRFSSA